MDDGTERDPAMRECDYCGGVFFPEDMDGDYCTDCAGEIFGDDDSAATAPDREKGA